MLEERCVERNDLVHHRERHRERLVCMPQDEDRQDRQCERKRDEYARPDPKLRLNGDSPIQLVHRSFDDVHAHATAGDVRYLFLRGEAWQEDELKGLRRVQTLYAFRVHQVLFHGFATQDIGIHAAAVVVNLDDDVRTNTYR